MENNLHNNRLTLRDRTYNLLTQAGSFEAFSNDGFTGPQTSPTFFDSLESIHGQLHVLTGKNGHMGVVDYAAFDPVFWLHHTNVGSLLCGRLLLTCFSAIESSQCGKVCSILAVLAPVDDE